MARTTTISDEQILNAAREMFHQHGFGATTSQIADAAGVSEGSIFRRWSSKEELIIAAMGVQPPTFFHNLDELADSDHSVEEQFTILANRILDFFEENISKIHAVFACGLDLQQKLMTEDAPPVQGVKAFTRYFTHLRRSGRIRGGDPEILARMFVGGMHHFAFSEHTGLNEVMIMPRETYIRGVVSLLMNGIDVVDQVDGS